MRRSRSQEPIRTFTAGICGMQLTTAIFRSGNSVFSSSTRSLQTTSISTFWTPPKIIPEEVLPLRIVGRLVLDRNVDNFFAETEQVAFSSGMWCQVLISPTTRFCKGIFLPIRTPSLSDSVGPISSRSRCQIRNRRFRPFPALKGEVPSLPPSSPASATHPAGTVPCLENPIYDRSVRRLAGRVRLIL